jgi:hypothetical protein
MFVYEEEVEVDEVKLSEVPVPTEFATQEIECRSGSEYG